MCSEQGFVGGLLWAPNTAQDGAARVRDVLIVFDDFGEKARKVALPAPA